MVATCRPRAASAALLALLLLLPGLSPAAEAEGQPRSEEAEAIAAQAAELFDQHCSRTALSDTTVAAGAVADVSGIWRDVSDALDRTGMVYLLYWRGVLGQCMDQEERALDDLRAFVERAGGTSLWTQLVTDANKRVRRLERQMAGGPANPGLGAGIIGVVLSSGAGAAGGLAGWQWSVALETGAQILAEPHDDIALANLANQGDQAAGLTAGLGIGAGVLGTGAIVSFVVSAIQRFPPGGARAAPRTAVVIAPQPGGVAVSIGGEW
jgi:hypothetical protein